MARRGSWACWRRCAVVRRDCSPSPRRLRTLLNEERQSLAAAEVDIKSLSLMTACCISRGQADRFASNLAVMTTMQPWRDCWPSQERTTAQLAGGTDAVSYFTILACAIEHTKIYLNKFQMKSQNSSSSITTGVGV